MKPFTALRTRRAHSRNQKRRSRRATKMLESYLEQTIPPHSVTSRATSVVFEIIGFSMMATLIITAPLILLGSLNLTTDSVKEMEGVIVTVPTLNNELYYALPAVLFVLLGLVVFCTDMAYISKTYVRKYGPMFSHVSCANCVLTGVIVGCVFPLCLDKNLRLLCCTQLWEQCQCVPSQLSW